MDKQAALVYKAISCVPCPQNTVSSTLRIPQPARCHKVLMTENLTRVIIHTYITHTATDKGSGETFQTQRLLTPLVSSENKRKLRHHESFNFHKVHFKLSHFPHLPGLTPHRQHHHYRSGSVYKHTSFSLFCYNLTSLDQSNLLPTPLQENVQQVVLL